VDFFMGMLAAPASVVIFQIYVTDLVLSSVNAKRQTAVRGNAQVSPISSRKPNILRSLSTVSVGTPLALFPGQSRFKAPVGELHRANCSL
jgi:hypothetical protein